MTMSALDSAQCIKSAYDDTNGALKTVSVGAEYQVDIRATDGDTVIAVGTTDGTVSGTQTGIKTTAAGNLLVANAFSTRSDTYTAAATGTAVDVSATLCKSFSIQVKCTTAAADAWNIVLEVSLDATNYTTVLTHTEASGDKVILFTAASHYPALYFRSRCVSRTLGSATNLVTTIVGMN